MTLLWQSGKRQRVLDNSYLLCNGRHITRLQYHLLAGVLENNTLRVQMCARVLLKISGSLQRMHKNCDKHQGHAACWIESRRSSRNKGDCIYRHASQPE